jgi:hypothetical protein
VAAVCDEHDADDKMKLKPTTTATLALLTRICW